MIITRVPFRVSLFGGGTDLPVWFERNAGAVLSTTIDKYCYVTARPLPPFFDHRVRLAYSRIELARELEEIEHPLIRAALQRFDRSDIEIHYDADLPAWSGLGTSSAFGVGLVGALAGLEGRLLSRKDLAIEAIRLERHVLNEPGGYQDQVAAAFGGFNHIKFHPTGDFEVHPIVLPPDRMLTLQRSLMLCYIPMTRKSGDVSVAGNYDADANDPLMAFLYESVNTALRIMANGEISDLGELMHQTWFRKRQLPGTTNSRIDDAYQAARDAGATGGKILGAGAGGFMLLFCPEEKQRAVRERLSDLLFVPFSFDRSGMQVIHYQPSARH
ncbi:MAG: kinase [Gemmatimonadetes bacterium]|nr:kinase [Gemmatimonadota bacterium]MDA1104588.1 kinase [Gemmatimonadota bacterium]